jgi:hypothetical protein
VNTLVLSGTTFIVPSGTRCSCHREPKSGLLFAAQHQSGDSNLANNESNVVRLRCRAWTTQPITDLRCSEISSSNQHLREVRFADDVARRAPQVPCMQGSAGAP